MNIKKELIKIRDNDNNRLRRAVAKYALEYYSKDDDIIHFFKDLLSHGCVSGMVGNLIYYHDTVKFFDDYEDEIENLITQSMEDQGIKTRPLFINSLNGSAENITQEKNLLAWFGFEEIARDIFENDLKQEW